MSTCFGCEIQTVSSCLNRTKITENRRQKLKPNREKSEPWQPYYRGMSKNNLKWKKVSKQTLILTEIKEPQSLKLVTFDVLEIIPWKFTHIFPVSVFCINLKYPDLSQLINL